MKYTLEMLSDNSPDLFYSRIYKEYMKDVDDRRSADRPDHPQQAGAAVVPGRVRPRSANHVIVPKHICEREDPKTFTNYDVAKN